MHRNQWYDLRAGYIALLSRLGWGQYPQHRRENNATLADFVERHADYIAFWTHYLTESAALDLGRQSGFRASFRYTSGFYAQKLRSLLRKPQTSQYQAAPAACGTA